MQQLPSLSNRRERRRPLQYSSAIWEGGALPARSQIHSCSGSMTSVSPPVAMRGSYCIPPGSAGPEAEGRAQTLTFRNSGQLEEVISMKLIPFHEPCQPYSLWQRGCWVLLTAPSCVSLSFGAVCMQEPNHDYILLRVTHAGMYFLRMCLVFNAILAPLIWLTCTPTILGE